MRQSIIDGAKQLVRRPIYLTVMVGVPLLTALFFLSLLNAGLPQQLPTAVVDMDNSATSRSIVRRLAANQLTQPTCRPTSYAEALTLLKQGRIYAFFLIPDDYERNALSGGTAATLTYYVNLAYYVPGSLSYKSLKLLSVTTSGSVATALLADVGVGEPTIAAIEQPTSLQVHPYGNPWANYSIYLSNSFIPCALQLVIFQVTAFSFLEEIKRGSSPRWLARARGSIARATLGKLLPQLAVFATVGMATLALLYGYNHFPLNGNAVGMVAAMLLFIVASQGVALAVCSLLPNLRMALSVLSLLGILSFSLGGFSFPVEQMYGAVAVFSYMLPVRHYFLIYVNTALNGYALYYCRWEYAALMLMALLPWPLLWRLKRWALRPTYVP